MRYSVASACPTLLLFLHLRSRAARAFKPPQISYDDELPPAPDPAGVADDRPRPLAHSVQPEARYRAVEESRPKPDRADGSDRERQRRGARPARAAGYINAMQVYPYSPGALYQIYAAPGQITDIALEPGEQLVGSGPVAAGDTVRWVIGDTESGSGPTKRIHILVKPTRPSIETNLVINTDRRTYHVELRSRRKDLYGIGLLVLCRGSAHRAARQNAASRTPLIRGSTQRQLPLYDRRRQSTLASAARAYDDGRKVYIEFSTRNRPRRDAAAVRHRAGRQGRARQLPHSTAIMLIVDRLFAAAELRLGGETSKRSGLSEATGGRCDGL